ncbi:MAG TPA: hypothetical protein PLG02_11295 [Methylotenera sp.]|nr:hypothetical protein [Methylotenera sp.]
MDIFNSEWLIRMLEKSSKTPQGRILSLFDILGDWLAAPNLHVTLSAHITSHDLLTNYLGKQATAMRAASPEILAEHIALIARNAALQTISEPNSNHLMHAKVAANALILAQLQKEWSLPKLIQSKRTVYGIAASLFVIGLSFTWLPALIQTNAQQNIIVAIDKASNSTTSEIKTATFEPNPQNVSLSAHEAATMYAKYEQMRNGTCQFPEAIQIPDKDKAIYLENVVGGKLPSNLKDLATANYYLEKVRCNFTPMLMANSVG